MEVTNHAASWPHLAATTAPPRGFRASRLLATGLVPLGAVLTDYLFYDEKPGFNFLAYTVFVVAVQLALLPRLAAARRSAGFWVMVGGSLLSGGLVAWYGSSAAVLACVVSLALLLGLLNQPRLRLLAHVGATALTSAWQSSAAVWRGWQFETQHLDDSSGKLRRALYYLKLLAVPLLVLGLFHGLFAVANPRYADLSSRVLAKLGEWLAALLPEISIGHLLFFGICFFLSAAALVVVPVYYFADRESRLGEFIRRQRNRVASFGVRQPDFRRVSFRALDLRKEYLMALAVFGLVNLLLLVVNAIDINWIWFGFVPAPGFDLTQFVHEGTYVLIFSILLAMGIVLWFFRRNLNFYAPGLPVLRWGATIWTMQNVILVVSVALRNYYYILHTGLAYKRIGVCFFLLLTLFGLATVLLKVWQLRSAFSLVRLNAWAAYAVLLLLAAGNWEVWIARYNLQSRFRTIDAGFLLDMPPRVLPVLLERQAVLLGARELVAEDEDGIYAPISPATVRIRLRNKVGDFREYNATHPDWQRCTVSESMAADYLSKK